MRYTFLILMLAAGTASAAQLDIAVSEGAMKPQTYSYSLSGESQTLDLRDSNRYNVAFLDKGRGKEICRQAEYRTGTMLSMRELEHEEDESYKVEIIGQISKLLFMDEGVQLACGVNQAPKLEIRAFSETTELQADRTKVLVIDGTTTLLLTIKE